MLSCASPCASLSGIPAWNRAWGGGGGGGGCSKFMADLHTLDD